MRTASQLFASCSSRMQNTTAVAAEVVPSLSLRQEATFEHPQVFTPCTCACVTASQRDRLLQCRLLRENPHRISTPWHHECVLPSQFCRRARGHTAHPGCATVGLHFAKFLSCAESRAMQTSTQTNRHNWALTPNHSFERTGQQRGLRQARANKSARSALRHTPRAAAQLHR